MQNLQRRVDGLFAGWMAGQWVCGVLAARVSPPLAWEGMGPGLSPVQTAVLLGAVLCVLPWALARSWAGRVFQSQQQALVRAEQQLRDVQQQCSRLEKLARVGQLAASISHELRNPLAAARTAVSCVLMRVANLQDALKDSRILHLLDVTERELAACSRIVSDVLDFARERPPQLAPCALRPLVDEVFGMVSQRAGVRLVNGVPESLPVPRLDRELFRMVLVNLVQNAVEAVPAGSEGTVHVRAEGGEATPWCLRVVDDGPGIPAEVLPRIFEPLFTTKTHGTGLGLAIVSALVNKHGGTLTVHTEPGQGTEFLIELPSEALARTA